MLRSRINSFRYALNGLKTALKDQPNFLIHCLIGSIAIAMGAFFDIAQVDWLVLFLVIGIVLTVELTNTAIEEIVNSFTDQIHPAAKKAKDVAAAAVLVSSISAVIIGLIIFLPYL
jgi:undecaprenol kinase